MWTRIAYLPGGSRSSANAPRASETDARFAETFDRLLTFPLSYLHAFTYSERPGSAACAFDGAVLPEIRKRRTQALRRLSVDKSLAFRRRHLGLTMEVLVEGMRKPETDRMSGLTDNYIRVDLGAGRAEQALVRAALTSLTYDGMLGERIAA